MRIDRMEVEGGFLDGFAVSFERGLNVLIGARGAGKTSVLELIRFALAVPAMTEQAAAEAAGQATAVLGDGTVTVYCTDQGKSLVFSRTGLDEVSAASSRYGGRLPLIVSQNEIEEIGLDPSSRREILDRLIASDSSGLTDEDLGGEVAAIERRIELLRSEREEVAESGGRAGDLEKALAQADKDQKSKAADPKKLESLQDEVAEASDELGQLRAAEDSYESVATELGVWRKELKRTQIDRSLPELSSAAIEAQVAKRVGRASEFVEKAQGEIIAAQKTIEDAEKDAKARQKPLQKRLKEKTARLERLQKGAGELGRRVSALRQELKAAEGQRKRVGRLDKELRKLTGQRDGLLDQIEADAEGRFGRRKTIGDRLTERFNGRIEVRIDKSGELRAYKGALVELLQGSNLQYKNLAERLAEKVSPRELVEAVETGDAARLSDISGISENRVAKLMAHLEAHSLSPLLLAPLDDSVDFALLDGQDYKLTNSLSMGQRCTVVLPMLLAEEREAILLDQPEDHLDNAFIVETLVAAIRDRTESAQLIIATHNANIPVLGEAEQVIVLASDGRRGFAVSAEELEAESSVEAITTLMEGGREAFAQRAEFYEEHPDG